jgi:Rrf2 family protein
MRISAKAEYACVAMLELAAGHGEPQPLRIKAIADAHGIPQRFLVQILLQLKTAGLVASVRGAAGGYQLTRSPEQISLAEVINAIDDRSLTPRSELGKANRTSVVEALLAVWRQIFHQEQELLEELSLAELLRRARTQSDVASYQI